MTFAHGARSFDELKQLLIWAWEQGGVAWACPCCGNPTWRLLHDGQYDGAGLTLRAGTAILPFNPSYMVYAVECTKCGFVRLFGKEKIEQLAEQRRQSLATLPPPWPNAERK